jgi:hypothetical protein
MPYFYASEKPGTFGISKQIFRHSGSELFKTRNMWDVMGTPGRIGYLKKCMFILWLPIISKSAITFVIKVTVE